MRLAGRPFKDPADPKKKSFAAELVAESRTAGGGRERPHDQRNNGGTVSEDAKGRVGGGVTLDTGLWRQKHRGT